VFNITLKRPLATLAVTAGMLAAAAGPASASAAGPLIAPAQTGNLALLQWSDPGTLDMPDYAPRHRNPATGLKSDSNEVAIESVTEKTLPSVP
jgi:hypothetical protein